MFDNIAVSAHCLYTIDHKLVLYLTIIRQENRFGPIKVKMQVGFFRLLGEYCDRAFIFPILPIDPSFHNFHLTSSGNFYYGEDCLD